MTGPMVTSVPGYSACTAIAIRCAVEWRRTSIPSALSVRIGSMAASLSSGEAQVDHLAVELSRDDIANLARTIEQHIADAGASFNGAAGAVHSYRNLGTHLAEMYRIGGIHM